MTMEDVMDFTEAARILYLHPDTVARYTEMDPPLLVAVKVGSVRKVSTSSVERYRALEGSLPWSLKARGQILNGGNRG